MADYYPEPDLVDYQEEDQWNHDVEAGEWGEEEDYVASDEELNLLGDLMCDDGPLDY